MGRQISLASNTILTYSGDPSVFLTFFSFTLGAQFPCTVPSEDIYLTPIVSHPGGKTRVIASPKTWIDGSAVEQLKKTSEWPGMKLAVGLPDLHPGKGTPIGAAFISEGAVYPALVGSDIGCGIGLWRTTLNGRKPKREAWADKLRGLDDAWNGDTAQWLAARDIAPSGFEHSLGTIGSGNHFAELQAIESIANPAACAEHGLTEDAAYLCVHSGSRGFGESILRDHIEDSSGYLARHNHAVQWARANRELIAARIFDCLGAEGTRLFDVCHNSVEPIDFEGAPAWLHRKGAAPSTAGLVVIPGSRGAFSYVVRPADPTVSSAYSLAHGAGRKWSRSDSRARLEKRYSPKDFARTELGSHVICEDKGLLYEEAPQAYKNITTVIADLVDAGLAEVIAILKPVITYKVRR